MNCADGASLVFGLYFGWIYAIVYFTIWFVPTWIIRALFSLVKRLKSSNQAVEATP